MPNRPARRWGFCCNVSPTRRCQRGSSDTGPWGSPQRERARDPTLGVYVARLRTMVDGPVREELTSNVRTIGDMVRADAENYENAYKDLRLYVMLVTAPDHLEPEWAANGIAEAWAGALRSDAPEAASSPPTRATMSTPLATHPAWVWKPDEAVLGRARSKLSSQPLEEIHTGGCSAKPKGSPPSGPRSSSCPSAQYFSARGGVMVPGAYTKEGWQKVHAALETTGVKLLIEPWVFGGKALEQTDAQRTSSAERQKEILFPALHPSMERLARRRHGRDTQQLALGYRRAARPLRTDGPYLRLFRAISENAILDMGATTMVGKAVDKGKDFFASATDKLMGVDAGTTERQVSPSNGISSPFCASPSGILAGPSPTPPRRRSASISRSSRRSRWPSVNEGSPRRADPEDFDRELARTSSVVERLLGGFDSAHAPGRSSRC